MAPVAIAELAAFNAADEASVKDAATIPEKTRLAAFIITEISSSTVDPDALPILLLSAKIILRSSDASSAVLKTPSAIDLYTSFAAANDASSTVAVKVLLNAFVSSEPSLSTELKVHFIQNAGLEAMIALLQSATSASLQLQVVKVFHLFCGTVPSITTILVENHNLLHMLISSLCYCVRNKPESPYIPPPIALLTTEILRTLFSIACANPHYLTAKTDESLFHMMTQLGVVCVDMLHKPQQTPQLYNLKLDVVKLLMYMPTHFAEFLRVNKCMGILVGILDSQCDAIVVEKERGGNDSVQLVPILSVLKSLCENSRAVCEEVKEAIFPKARDEEMEKEAALKEEEAAKEALLNPVSEEDAAVAAAADKNKHIAPQDAPQFSLRWKVIRLMMSVDTNVKRYSSEFLWIVCRGDPKEFVARTGFGNAVHFMGIKGLVNIPEQTTQSQVASMGSRGMGKGVSTMR